MARCGGGRGVFLPAILLGYPFLLLTGCQGLPTGNQIPQTTIFPVSDFAWKIQNLYAVLFWLSILVFVSVEAILIYSVIRFRRRPETGMPPQVHGNTRLEIAWTIAPAVVLAFIGVPTISTIFDTARPAPPEALKVQVIGHQWWWEFRYPELNIVTANELHLPAGRPVTFSLESADVIHSFWLPRLGGKQDVTPNRVNHLTFTPERPEVYYGQCVEFCGVQHALMRLLAVVQPEQDFQAWVRAQQAPPVPPSDDMSRRGAELFARGACAGCHTVAGTTAQGKFGPDLTHVGSRMTIAARTLPNTPENLAAWLRDPQRVKPGNRMPNLNLSEEDISLLVAYLQSLK